MNNRRSMHLDLMDVVKEMDLEVVSTGMDDFGNPLFIMTHGIVLTLDQLERYKKSKTENNIKE